MRKTGKLLPNYNINGVIVLMGWWDVEAGEKLGEVLKDEESDVNINPLAT